MRIKSLVKNKKSMAMLRKALAVSVDGGDSDVSSYLPAPLALQVIAFIREINIMRRLLKTFNMATRTWKKPKKNSAMSAYFIPDGVAATETGFTSTSITWEAKKLMSYVVIDEEAVEDSQPDLMSQVMQDFGDAVGEAEEKMLLQGDTSHLATSPTPVAATDSNWYTRDPRLMFDGIFTVAAAAGAATPIDAATTAFDPQMINKALYNLGKYGRVKAKIIGICPSDQAANIRGNSDFNQYQLSGQLAAFVTGMGGAGEGDAAIVNIFGVKMYEAPQAPAGKIAIFHKDSPQIGDRRMIKLASDVIIEQDQRKHVVSERIAFNYDYRDALCLITNLQQTIVS